jgi:alkylhydroperoxidase family enzyme
MPERDAWIHMVGEDEAQGELQALYAQLVDPHTGQIDNILRIHGQHPATLRAHYLLYRTLMYGTSGVPRPEREIIAVVVSALNRCHY